MIFQVRFLFNIYNFSVINITITHSILPSRSFLTQKCIFSTKSVKISKAYEYNFKAYDLLKSIRRCWVPVPRPEPVGGLTTPPNPQLQKGCAYRAQCNAPFGALVLPNKLIFFWAYLGKILDPTLMIYMLDITKILLLQANIQLSWKICMIMKIWKLSPHLLVTFFRIWCVFLRRVIIISCQNSKIYDKFTTGNCWWNSEKIWA